MPQTWTTKQRESYINWFLKETSVGSNVPPTITTTTLSNGILSGSYSETVFSTGDSPITFSVVVGDLPPWASLDTDTGEISGIPNLPGYYLFTVQAENAYGTDAQELSITVPNEATGGGELESSPSLTGTVEEDYDTVLSEISLVSPNGIIGTVEEDYDTALGISVAYPNLEVSGTIFEDYDTVFGFADNPEALPVYPKGGKKKRRIIIISEDQEDPFSEEWELLIKDSI